MGFEKSREQIAADTGIPVENIKTAEFNMGEYFGIAYDGGSNDKRTAWKLRFDAEESDYRDVCQRLADYHAAIITNT